MQCQIISIGNELLTGDTENTNASWIARFVTENGFEVSRIHTIGDDAGLVKKTVQKALSESSLVITTGGLGPTHDDVSKKAVAELFDSKLIRHKPTLEFIRKIFKERNIPFSKSNYQQAEVPDCCEVLFNKKGTAPGMWFDREKGKLAVLAGVPFEMKYLMKEHVLPKMVKMSGIRKQQYSHYILTAGAGESTLSDDIIGDLNSFLNDSVSVAYLPGLLGNRIRISGYGETSEEAEKKIQPVMRHILDRSGNLVVGEGKELTLSQSVGKQLRNRNLTIAVAESCTGGSLADTITETPGSGDYMIGGIISYANEVKVSLLGVTEEMLKAHGAVSKKVALQMAKGIAGRLNTDIGISTTGIAGPGGGSLEKPVGTVWIGYWDKNQHFALKALFTDDRHINKKRTVGVALDTIRRCIAGIPEMPYGLKKQEA